MGGMVDSKKQLLLVSERLVDVLWRQNDVLIKVGETAAGVKAIRTVLRPLPRKPPPLPTNKPNNPNPINNEDSVLDASKHLFLLELYSRFYEESFKLRDAVKRKDDEDAKRMHFLVTSTRNTINRYIFQQKITDAQKDKCIKESIEIEKEVHPFRPDFSADLKGDNP